MNFLSSLTKIPICSRKKKTYLDEIIFFLLLNLNNKILYDFLATVIVFPHSAQIQSNIGVVEQ